MEQRRKGVTKRNPLAAKRKGTRVHKDKKKENRKFWSRGGWDFRSQAEKERSNGT